MQAILRAVNGNVILRAASRNIGVSVGVVLLVIVGVAYISILGMSPEAQEELLSTVQDFLPIIMFLTLATLLFTGFPVAFILGGVALLFGLIGYFLDMFSLIEFSISCPGSGSRARRTWSWCRYRRSCSWA